MYSLFSYLAYHSKEEEYKNVSLIWTFRGDCLYKEWKNDLKYIKMNKSKFHINLHCTKGNENVKNESDFEIKLNRPNFETYLKDLKNDCLKVKENTIGIYICGNDEIVENLIKYTRKENLKTIGKFRYDIHHETFQF